ncbi:hypothetical protein NLU13_0356 [Sarocladium strictum]|uniref:Uncharacterized protein n=1 Tax=Sarocladium strictum TaxID=5046 RepID=A0AA39GQD5_SARSR|nr:hypothetical protein NLU13_0356 [Sarocladium strictum]
MASPQIDPPQDPQPDWPSDDPRWMESDQDDLTVSEWSDHSSDNASTQDGDASNTLDNDSTSPENGAEFPRTASPENGDEFPRTVEVFNVDEHRSGVRYHTPDQRDGLYQWICFTHDNSDSFTQDRVRHPSAADLFSDGQGRWIQAIAAEIEAAMTRRQQLRRKFHRACSVVAGPGEAFVPEEYHADDEAQKEHDKDDGGADKGADVGDDEGNEDEDEVPSAEVTGSVPDQMEPRSISPPTVSPTISPDTNGPQQTRRLALEALGSGHAIRQARPRSRETSLHHPHSHSLRSSASSGVAEDPRRHDSMYEFPGLFLRESRQERDETREAVIREYWRRQNRRALESDSSDSPPAKKRKGT